MGPTVDCKARLDFTHLSDDLWLQSLSLVSWYRCTKLPCTVDHVVNNAHAISEPLRQDSTVLQSLSVRLIRLAVYWNYTINYQNMAQVTKQFMSHSRMIDSCLVTVSGRQPISARSPESGGTIQIFGASAWLSIVCPKLRFLEAWDGMLLSLNNCTLVRRM